MARRKARVFARVERSFARLSTRSLLTRRGLGYTFREGHFAGTWMTDAFAVVKIARHGLIASYTAGHVLLVARDVEHDSVATSAGLLDGNEARWTIAFVARVGVGRMTTSPSL